MSTSLPSTWVYVRLDQTAIVVAGNPAPQGSEYFQNGKFNLVRVHDMGVNGNNTFLTKTRDQINDKAAVNMRLISSNSVLFTKSGASTLLNQRAILAKDSYVVSHIAAALPFNGVESKWLFYFLQLFDFSTLAHATNMPSLPLSRAKAIRVPLAPMNEQTRIVAKIEELFSELDKGVESLKTARAKLNVYRQAVLKYAFEGKLTAQWREENKDKLETPEQLLARIKQERAARYQRQLREWETAVKKWEESGVGRRPVRPQNLKEISLLSLPETEILPSLPGGWSYLRLGLVINEPKYGTSKKCDYNYKGKGVLRIPNVVRGVVDASDLKGAHFEEDEKCSYALRNGDILMIRSNGSISIVGKCAIISEAEEQYLYAGYLIRIRSSPVALLPDYLAALLSSHLLRTQIEHKAKSTSGVNNINSGEIQSLIVQLCSLSEQEVVVERLSACLSKTNAIEAEINNQLLKADALRQSILKKAFAGQLDPQDSNDEPASELLKRITEEKARRDAAVKVATKKAPP